TIRTLGKPSASTVASAIALGSAGSEASASANHLEKRASGSSTCAKSPDVNPLWCSIGAVSDMGGLVSGVATRESLYRATLFRRLRRERQVPACALAIVVLGFCLGGCSYPLGSL